MNGFPAPLPPAGTAPVPALALPPAKTPAPPVLLTAPEAARAHGISERMLRNITVPHGSLPVVKIGRSVRFRRRTLEEFAAREETGPRSAAR